LIVDTHCHLDYQPFDADREQVIVRARAAGVERIIVVGTSLLSSSWAVKLSEKYEGLYGAVGVHPNSTAAFGAKEIDQLREFARAPKVVAIGEIGIDLYRKTVPFERQERVFRAQLALAAELEKPVIIHDREAHTQVMAVLRDQAPAAGVVLHSFSGDERMAEQALALGFYLGVDGPLTYKKNDSLRAIFAAAPLDRILVETDAPYLTPQARRGARNEPAFVKFVVEKLAEVRGLAVEAVASATTENAARLFKWKLT